MTNKSEKDIHALSVQKTESLNKGEELNAKRKLFGVSTDELRE
jgi:hypothetical protein